MSISEERPAPPIPIFCLHAGERAFCTLPGCFCNTQNLGAIKALLAGVCEGYLTMHEQTHGAIRWEVPSGSPQR